MDYSISLSEILIGSLTLISAGLGFIIREQREKIRIVRNQLSEKKYKVYNEVFSIFFDLIKEQKGLKEAEDSNLVNQLIDIKKDLLVYAPDIIVKKFIEWNRFISNHKGDIKHAYIYLELFVLIRKDMGNNKTTISESDILKLIMTSDNESETMWKMIKN
jgi:hypothetical protein